MLFYPCLLKMKLLKLNKEQGHNQDFLWGGGCAISTVVQISEQHRLELAGVSGGE